MMDGQRGMVHLIPFRSQKLNVLPYRSVLRYVGNPVSCPSYRFLRLLTKEVYDKNNVSKKMQVILACGGRGSRLFSRYGTIKPLIKVEGKPLLYYSFKGLTDSKIISEVIVVANEKNIREIKAISERFPISKRYVVFKRIGRFREIPYRCRDLLDDSFYLVCGHQPVEARHLEKMAELRKGKDDWVISLYSDKTEDEYIIVEKREDKKVVSLREISEKRPCLEEKVKFLHSPHLLTRKVIKLSKEDNFQHRVEHYIEEYFLRGGIIPALEAPMPPEADREADLEIVKKYLRRKEA